MLLETIERLKHALFIVDKAASAVFATPELCRPVLRRQMLLSPFNMLPAAGFPLQVHGKMLMPLSVVSNELTKAQGARTLIGLGGLVGFYPAAARHHCHAMLLSMMLMPELQRLMDCSRVLSCAACKSNHKRHADHSLKVKAHRLCCDTCACAVVNACSMHLVGHRAGAAAKAVLRGTMVWLRSADLACTIHGLTDASFKVGPPARRASPLRLLLNLAPSTDNGIDVGLSVMRPATFQHSQRRCQAVWCLLRMLCVHSSIWGAERRRQATSVR